MQIGSPHAIYAYGNSDPATNGDISYHGFSNRGSQGIVFISSSANDQQAMPVNVQKLQFHISNVIIPSRETYYYNVIQKVPDLPSKMHILKVNCHL